MSNGQGKVVQLREATPATEGEVSPQPLAPAVPAGLDVAALAQQLAALLPQVQAPAKPQGPTFGELADTWLAIEGKRLVCPDNERRHLAHVQALWTLREGELTPRVVKDTLATLLKPTGPLSASTVNKVRSTGKRIIRDAQQNGEWGAINPFETVRRQKESKPSHRVFSLAEVRALLPHLRPDRMMEAVVCASLGPRPGELKAIQKGDVNRERRTLTWRRSNGRDSTKTGRDRTVPIPDEIWPIIETALISSPGELLFPGPDGERQRADAKLSRTLRDALSKAGIVDRWDYSCRRKGCGHKESGDVREDRRCPACGFKLWAHGVAPKVRWYDLRHSAATLHRKAGCDPLVIKLVLGHAVASVTDDIYTHLDEDYMRAELNKLRLFAEPSEPSPAPTGGGDFTAPSSGAASSEGKVLSPAATGESGCGAEPEVVGGEAMPDATSVALNVRPKAWEARALPTELPPRFLAGGLTANLLTVKDLATRLRVSRTVAYELVGSGAVRSVRIGHSIRIRPEDVEAYLAGRLT